MLPLLLGIAIAVFVLGYLFYASITVKHAARFRYLSKRTVYLTILFIALSGVLLAAVATLYGVLLFN